MKSTLTLILLTLVSLSFSQTKINSESQENINRLISQGEEKSIIELKKDNPLRRGLLGYFYLQKVMP